MSLTLLNHHQDCLSKTNSKKGIFSFLLQHGMKDFFLNYFLPDFFSPQEMIQTFCSPHSSNRALRKQILTCESLWDLQFKYLFPTLYEMKHQLLNTNQWWTLQRQERLNHLLNESQSSTLTIYSSDGQSLIPLDQNEEYTKEMIQISCRNEFMSLIVDHAFYETNFNENSTRCAYAKNFILFRFFFLMIKSNRSLANTQAREEGLSIHKIMQNNYFKQEETLKQPLLYTVENWQTKLPPRGVIMMKYGKIYESLLVDMIFKTNKPLTAYSLLKFGWSHACDDDKLSNDDHDDETNSKNLYFPYIDFSYGNHRSYYNRFFQIHPFVKLTEFQTKKKRMMVITGEKKLLNFFV
ncbi:hypothetical protein FDP41_010846 [Naegleria fowleri]|uniref:Uncharacterized protein n=1 Tax=Naegleria fowleri TaxID=5763 RepID=A0A6A5C063_NAEFO|nr:uncharacterized protein FDP41_010846 [Naegleria fowleri]KAF0982867.1 hypothetical protein FDP41_010846 [Naegleria fowleri]